MVQDDINYCGKMDSRGCTTNTWGVLHQLWNTVTILNINTDTESTDDKARADLKIPLLTVNVSPIRHMFVHLKRYNNHQMRGSQHPHSSPKKMLHLRHVSNSGNTSCLRPTPHKTAFCLMPLFMTWHARPMSQGSNGRLAFNRTRPTSLMLKTNPLSPYSSVRPAFNNARPTSPRTRARPAFNNTRPLLED